MNRFKMVTMIEGGFTMKILFYDTKSYDKESFDAALSRFPEIEIEYIKSIHVLLPLQRASMLYALLSAQT